MLVFQSIRLLLSQPHTADDYAAEAAAAAVEAIEAGAEDAPDAAAAPATADAKRKVSRPKRLCRFPGCNKVVKSQGACQKHGAKPKKCKVPDCNRQSQGNFDGELIETPMDLKVRILLLTLTY